MSAARTVTVTFTIDQLTHVMLGLEDRISDIELRISWFADRPDSASERERRRAALVNAKAAYAKVRAAAGLD